MSDHTQTHQRADRFSARAMRALNKEYLVIGRKKVHAFYSWLALGMMVGVAIGIALVANNTGQFEQSSAAVTLNTVTTLAAQTGNNTSAASNFGSLFCHDYITKTTVPCTSNGNMSPTNISKVDIHTLLSSGHATKVFAHWVPWFGPTNHMEIGYTSNDQAETDKQVTDMVSRGIDGVIVNWYGPGNTSDLATLKLKNLVASHPGFLFSIMVDKGALTNGGVCEGCDGTKVLISQLNYLANTYYALPGYWRIGGRPVVTEFDLDLHFKINWATVRASVAGNPFFVFKSNFTHVQSGGTYVWAPNSGAAVTSFYNTAASHPTQEIMGSVFKGFNDTSAAWTMNRINPQNCGQTWLDSFTRANAFIATNPGELDALQIVTWNDYEEATAMELGVDNCINITAHLVAPSTIAWTLTGKQNTVNHVRVFASRDEQRLGIVEDDSARGARSLDLAGLVPGGTT